MMEEINRLKQEAFSGRNLRLLREWEILDLRLANREDMDYRVARYNAKGIAVEYDVFYHIRSFCGIDSLQKPLFADEFALRLAIPEGFPCVDSPVELFFLSVDVSNRDMPCPWHPNIRYHGTFRGRVCLNKMDSFTEIAWCVERVASYLRYERYHALNYPPFPEDLTVAKWVVEYGEPMGYINQLLNDEK
ncbi:hypothetical protein [Parabacteroides sp.]